MPFDHITGKPVDRVSDLLPGILKEKCEECGPCLLPEMLRGGLAMNPRTPSARLALDRAAAGRKDNINHWSNT